MSAVLRENPTIELDICDVNDILPFGGVAALINGEQAALFRLGDGSSTDDVFAVSNFDPFSKANVLSRGIVGSVNDIAVVASPIYKQHFDLKTGLCLEDETVVLKTWATRIENGRVIVAAAVSE